jgi:hypothetical protein
MQSVPADRTRVCQEWATVLFRDRGETVIFGPRNDHGRRVPIVICMVGILWPGLASLTRLASIDGISSSTYKLCPAQSKWRIVSLARSCDGGKRPITVDMTEQRGRTFA